MTRAIQAGMWIVALASWQVSWALSTVTPLTQTNAQRFPFLVIKAVKEGPDHTQFMVDFTAPANLAASDDIGAALELRAGGNLVSRCSVSGARPTDWSKSSERQGQRPMRFAFTVRREHLEESKFGLWVNYPDFSRMDEYWFYLKDFVQDK